MNLQLNDRVALVTGGSKGIGAAIARQLAQEGARVAICARPSSAMAALKDELTASGFVCDAFPTDATDSNQVASSVKSVASRWGTIDLLVNNVGGAVRFGGFEELTDTDWLRAYELNVMPVVRFTRAALPYLRRSSLRRVINISSISALQPGMYNPHYTANKAAVVNLGKHLANALAKDGILVNTVCPGPVHSDSWDTNVRQVAAVRGLSEAEARASIEIEESAKIPLGTVGNGDQVAAAVAFLASPLSSWTTGSCFHIDGGKLSAAL